MALRDAHNEYSNAQALTATAASTNVIDHGQDRNLGIGEPMAVEIVLDVAADATDANETYTVDLQTDTVEAFSSPTNVGGQVTITRGDAAGTMYYIPLPPNEDIQRFTRLNFTLGGTTPSVTVTAHLVPMSGIENQTKYADDVTIS